MPRFFFFLALALILYSSQAEATQDHDDGPLISITSPDNATTFAYGTVKNHSLIWNKKDRMLVARVTFTDAEQNIGTPNDDTHEFRLPGVSFDEVKGLFFATSPKGEAIPVAHIKKTLFIKSIETLPNAVVRILRQRSNVTVILEAISPNDPALHSAPNSSPDATHQVDINKILN